MRCITATHYTHLQGAEYLTSQFYTENYMLRTRLDMLDTIAAAAVVRLLVRHITIRANKLPATATEWQSAASSFRTDRLTSSAALRSRGRAGHVCGRHYSQARGSEDKAVLHQARQGSAM